MMKTYICLEKSTTDSLVQNRSPPSERLPSQGKCLMVYGLPLPSKFQRSLFPESGEYSQTVSEAQHWQRDISTLETQPKVVLRLVQVSDWLHEDAGNSFGAFNWASS